MRYLLWGYYGFGNLGDELMLHALVERLRRHDPKAEIWSRTFGLCPLPEGVLAFGIDRMLAEAGRRHYLNVPSILHELDAMVSKVDALIIGGGTLFLDKGRHNKTLAVLALAVMLARLRRKKVFVTGVGIDRLTHPLSRRYVGYILRNSDFTCVRDRYSYDLAKQMMKMKDQDRLVLGADLLYSQDFVSSLGISGKRKKGKILLSIIDYFINLERDPAKREPLKRRFLALIKDIIASGREVVMVSFQKGVGERDFEYIREIYDSYVAANPAERGKISVVHLAGMEDIRLAFGGAEAVIGMRYHALVLAAIAGVPFIGINHEKKIEEICGEFGMPSVAIADFLAGKVNVFSLIEAIPDIDLAKVAGNTRSADNNFGFLGMVG